MLGIVQKIETLSDGSGKLSVYFNREQLADAVKFSYQKVIVELEDEQPSKDYTEKPMDVIFGLLDQLTAEWTERMKEAKEEL